MEESSYPNNQNNESGKKWLSFLEVGLFEACFVVITIVVLFGTLNYFNILSISTLYSKQFGFLPHRYDVVANKAALVGVEYSSDTERYILEGILYKINGETVSIEYKGKMVEFLLSPQINCEHKVTRIVLQTVKDTGYEPANCSDILSNSNSGKKVSITFFRDSADYNYINYFYINYFALE